MSSMPARYSCKLPGGKILEFEPTWKGFFFFPSQHYSIITIKDTEYTILGVLSS